jgi:hypothetical protein
MKPELVTLMSLNHERKWAYQTALCLRSGSWGIAHIYIGMFDCNPRFLQLVLDAYNNSGRFEPTTDRRRIIESYHKAQYSRASTGSGVDVSILLEGPTLAEVKKKFTELYPEAVEKKEMPGDETFKRAFRELRLSWRKRQPGRPQGSKDSDKRKRRKKYPHKKAVVALSVIAKNGAKLRRRAGI